MHRCWPGASVLYALLSLAGVEDGGLGRLWWPFVQHRCWSRCSCGGGNS